MFSILKIDGTNIFKDITIPAENSIDNKEHVVQSEEEFLKYYKIIGR